MTATRGIHFLSIGKMNIYITFGKVPLRMIKWNHTDPHFTLVYVL